MSRTFRNKNAVPHGYEVRDDGELYCKETGTRCSWHSRARFRRAPYRKERKAERKEHYRQYRSKVRDRMRHEDWEGIPRYRRTGGWLTW